MSSTSDANSNGIRYSCKNASPSRAVVGAETASVSGQGVRSAHAHHSAMSGDGRRRADDAGRSRRW